VLTPAERDYLEALAREREASEPPDKIERLLARKIAKIRGQPDPYGCDGLSEVERRARDWADYHEKERIT
jgi:hypothetical protein